ncbi:MAG: choice-of-anchor J domain-containing protein, partial [Bacteroidetes bacterium]|nr:choice-of-anchor J domain-containing protein [Bacteroidota bacterium]
MKPSIKFWTKIITIILFILPGIKSSGQAISGDFKAEHTGNPSWIELMQDPNANYYSTVNSFEKYRKNKANTNLTGWKVFKRWEYIMRGRVAADGTKPAPDAIFNEWNSFSQVNRSPAGNWVSLGPSTVPLPGPAGYLGLGRLNVIAFHPTDQNKVYAGAPSGGLWITNNNGGTWSPATDNLPTLGVSAVVVDFSNSNVILMGTGDRDHGDAPGMGVFKSTDGGSTWSASKTGMGNVTVCKIIQHPGNSQVYLAVTTSGIFRTTDGGTIWTLIEAGSFKDVCFKPGNPDIVYAASQGNFYRSTDNGLTFVLIINGLPYVEYPIDERGAIAVTEANPSYVYFIQSNSSGGFQGVYRSVDSGSTFTTRSTTPNILDASCDGSGTSGQGWHDLAIAADPASSEILYVGGINIWKSSDGGSTWTIKTHWNGECSVAAVHSEIHFLGFSPLNSRLYSGNDGGIYYTSNGGTSWTDCTSGMAIGQIYKIGQGQTDPLKTICGLQDNGTHTNLPTGWVVTAGGDGMECAVDFQNSSYTYHSQYLGSIFRKTDNANELQVAGIGIFGITESGAWVTPFILSENDPKKMFAGYQNVWRCADVTTASPVWTKISTNETADCSVLEQSPVNPDILYVVRNDSLKRTDNANATMPTWTLCTLPGGVTPSDMEAHPTQANTVYAVSGSKVYKSTDKGAYWTLVAGALPNIPVNTIVYDKNSSEGLYIGTQTGVLFKNSTMPNWAVFNTNLPVVDVRELEIYYSSIPSNNKIMAGTFGRGLWMSDLYSAPASAPVASFTSAPLVPCQGQTVQFTDLSTNNPTTWVWTFTPSTVTYVNSTNSNSQNPQVQFNTNAVYSIQLVAVNAYGSANAIRSVSVGGTNSPLTESFESGIIPESWNIANPDGGITWKITTAYGNGVSANAAYMDFYSYYSPKIGQVDDMITEPVKLTGTVNPYLTFKVAYRPYPGVSDTLKIFISTNCGNTWGTSPVYNKSGSVLATGADLTNPFIPSGQTDWRIDSVNLSPYISGSVQVKFQSVSGYGNNLYLDDVFIGEQIPTITVASPNGGESWQQGSVHSITWSDNISENVRIELYKGGVLNLTIAASTASTGTYSWTIPSGQPAGNDYSVKISSTTNSGIYDFGNSNFSISCITFNAGLIASSQSICYNTVPSLLTGIAPTGGSSPYSYQWQNSANNVTFTSISGATSLNYSPGALTATTYYRQVQTSSGGCGSLNTNVLTITVQPYLPVSLSIGVSVNPVCAGTSVTFTATPVNGGTTPAYQWKVNGANVTGATNATYSFIPVNGNNVACVLTSNATCVTGNPATSNTVTLTVNPLLPVSVSVGASANPVCAGTSVTFTATPTNGGTTPTYQWKVNGTIVSGATNATYSYIPVNGDAVLCMLTSNASCPTGNPATSNTLTMTVNPLLPVSVSVGASANPVCAGTSVTFTATPTNGGTIPSYKWKVNGSIVSAATNATYSYIPVNNDAVVCVLTSNLTCPAGNPATSNTVTMTVNPLLPVSVSVGASANPVCAGTSVTYTATPINGGASPTYKWKVNGSTVTGATNATYSFTPVNGNTIICVLTSNATCLTGSPATSNTITMTVNPLLPVSISVSASANPVCAGTSVTYSSTPTNGGTTPGYQWKVNGATVSGATNSTFIYSPANYDAIICTLTSSLGCPSGNPATSNAVTMLVNPLLPVSVSVGASANPVCAGTSVTFTATPTNGGTTPGYQWKVNGAIVSGATTSTYSYIPVNNDGVICLLTSNAICPTGSPATSNTVTMTVNPLMPVSVSVGASANPVCTGTSVTFTAIPTNGGTTPGYQWKVNGTIVSGATNATYVYIPVNSDAVVCVLTSNAICPTGNPATSNTVTMTVNPLLPVSVSVGASANPVCAGTSVTFSATPTNGGTTPTYQWKV